MTAAPKPPKCVPQGDHAFPFVAPLGDGSLDVCVGMSRRDYFAAHAVVGLLARAKVPPSATAVAQEAYFVADAMIAAGRRGGTSA